MDESGWYRQIVDAAQDGIWVFDSEGRTLFCNHSTAELLGRTDEEMRATSVFDVLDEPGKEQFAAHLDDLRAGHPNEYEVECCYLRPDGSPVWVMLSESTIYDAAGHVCGYFHRLTDYTERRALLEELRQSREQLAGAQEIAKTGSWDWDVVTGEITWSDQLRRMMCLDQEYVATAGAFVDRVVDADRDMVQEAVRRGREETGHFEYDARVRRGDGEVVWMRGSGLLFNDDDGTPVRMSGTVQDINDIKEVELQLLDAVVLNVLMQTMATAANESANLAEALAVAQEQLLGHDDWSRATAVTVDRDADGIDVLVPMVVGKPDTNAVPFYVEPTPLELDLAQRVLDSREILFEEQALPLTPLIAFPVQVGDEVVALVVITARSPFERHDMLRALVEHVAGQLGRVAERERTAIQLEAARDEAMEASRLKSDFLATMSHEIRTPMNGVIGLNHLLMRTNLDAHQRRLAEGVEGAGRALLAIITDILDFSKIEAGKLELESVDFDVRLVFDQVAALLAESAREKNIELVVGVRPEVPERLRGDPTRLSQVLSNLVSNAIKFTTSGEVLIRGRAGSTDGDGFVLRVEVSDTGIGVPATNQDRLFEPFSQADASTTRTHGGTGLGLAIARQLVAAIGGEIGVSSNPGAGSTFWFTGRFEVAEPVRLPQSDVERAGLLHGRRALVVVDNASNRLILSELLTEWKLDVREARSATEAMRLVRAARGRGVAFDVLILDMMLPDHDGLTLASMIRSETPEPWPKMLLLTSPEGVDAVQMAGAGVWVSLTKPVSRSALFDGVVDCLAEKGGLKDVHQDAQLASQQRDEHLLVVEDNQVNQLVALGVLEALGYTADVAVDGIEAVRMAHEKHYDGILMDVQMPRMDGYAATREIRAQEPHGQRMAIIAMTAAAVEGERDKCLAAGMDDFLTKPLEPKLLEVSLDHWLATAAARDGRGPDRHDPPPVVLDTGRLATLTAMGPAASIVVDRAISNFINTAAAALDELRTAVEACDAGQLRMASHKLRGSALNLGADAVGQMCLELEQLGEAGDTTTAHPRLTSLQSALDEAADALRDYRDNRALR